MFGSTSSPPGVSNYIGGVSYVAGYSGPKYTYSYNQGKFNKVVAPRGSSPRAAAAPKSFVQSWARLLYPTVRFQAGSTKDDEEFMKQRKALMMGAGTISG